MNQKKFDIMLKEFSDKNFIINECKLLLIIGSLPISGMLTLSIISKIMHIDEIVFLDILKLYLILSCLFSIIILALRIKNIIIFLREYKKKK